MSARNATPKAGHIQMSEASTQQYSGDAEVSGSRGHDPFAPEALLLAGTRMSRFLALLALIDRTVLPRVLTIETESAIFSLDVADRKLALLPRRQNAYAVDQQLAADAPKIHRLLGKRIQAVQKSSDRLASAREALLRCAGRLLWGLAGTARARVGIGVVERDEIATSMPFSALELYRTAADQAAGPAAGAASAYGEAMKPRALSAWRATRTGWVLDWPAASDSKADLRLIARISAAARDSSAWLERAGMGRAPSLSFLSGAGHRTIRCLAADETHIVQLSLQPSAWSGALQGWDAVCAHLARAGAAPRQSGQHS